VNNHLTMLLRCMQITGGFVQGKQVSRAKLDVFKELIQQEKGKVVVFYHFTDEQKALVKVLKSLGITYGDSSGAESGRERDALVEAYQTRDDPRVIVAQFGAGGISVTITAPSVAYCFWLNDRSDD